MCIRDSYENGYWTLGRQALLDPIEWTDDGWFVAKGGDLGQPLRKPSGQSVGVHGQALSDDFSSGRLGGQWAFFNPAADEMQRLSFQDGAMLLQGKGKACLLYTSRCV